MGLCWAPLRVNATNGMPGSAKFGYGVRLSITNPDLETALQVAGNLDLDWLGFDLDWSAFQPAPDTHLNWSSLDTVLSMASQQKIAVLVSITNPPAWVCPDSGPDPDQTASLTASLATRYPAAQLGFELFPGANTVKGWGADPDPQGYTRLIANVHRTLQGINPEITVVAAGLDPHTHAEQDIEDLAFLTALYQAGAAPFMPVVGLRLPQISAVPTESTRDTSAPALRHYEAIREIMLQNSHNHGLIWVTGFSWDPDAISSPEEQALWIRQAFLMMRAQLYIGAAFVQDLTPFSQSSTSHRVSTDSQYHPGINIIREIIAFDNSQHIETFEIGGLKSAAKPDYKKPISP